MRIARLFNTYGPRSRLDDGRVVPAFYVQAITGQPLTVFGSGQQTRSLCYIDDLVRGLIALMETPGLAGEVVNLGCPDDVTPEIRSTDNESPPGRNAPRRTACARAGSVRNRSSAS